MALQNIEDISFDDELHVDGQEILWRAVLMNAIDEAVRGPSMSVDKTAKIRIYHIEQARIYLTRPNRDFETVCALAGLDPDAVRERVTKQIAEAPSPEELAVTKRRSNYRTPGVVSNLSAFEGTGAGSNSQETPNLTFSGNDA
ncbi:hypothetical protein O9X94_00385 [Agrobacterium leguminum]|uniref:Uncharacterized protein n=1 Tax=Agrobacterium leguminum TaxID=2792015 RepID=A0A9X3HKM3_9HYPH|nr:hypothetical protein [Agrobacterium leguminum]MCZ7907749.1 hypothetical protein [Agrobacterium leguminum]